MENDLAGFEFFDHYVLDLDLWEELKMEDLVEGLRFGISMPVILRSRSSRRKVELAKDWGGRPLLGWLILRMEHWPFEQGAPSFVHS